MVVSTYTAKHDQNDHIRRAYSKNRQAVDPDYRAIQPNPVIMSADADAVGKMAEMLRALEYDQEHGVDVLQNTKAFVTTYNNLMDSTDASDSNDIAYLKKQLGKLTKDEKEDLASIGIEIKSDGKLSLDEKVFAESRPEKIRRILSSEGDLSETIRNIAKKIYRVSGRLPVYTAEGEKTIQPDGDSGKMVDLSL